MGDRRRKELDIGGEPGYFDKSWGIRLLIGLLFLVSLLFFLHFRETPSEFLRVNTIVDHDIISPIDFEFTDEEATLLLKQEALRDVGMVYRISETEVAERQMESEIYLTQHEEWREMIANSSLEEMYQAVDILSMTLNLVRFSDSRTLKKIHEANLPTTYSLPLTFQLSSQPILLSDEAWSQIQQLAYAGKDISPATQGYLISYFKHAKWAMEEDRAAFRNIRNAVQVHVKPKPTKIHQGSHLIDQGERVSSRHVEMVATMNSAMERSRDLWHLTTGLGSLIMAALLLSIAALYIRTYHENVFYSNQKLFLLAAVMILTMVIAKTTEYLLAKNTSHLIDAVRYPLFIPFAAILLCSLLSPLVAGFASIFLAIIFSMTLAVDQNGFLVINVLTSVVAILSTGALRQRKEVFVVCAKAWLCAFVVLFSLHLYQGTLWSTGLLTDLLTTLLSMIFTAVLVVGLLPVFESFFHIITDITLMEYMDPNHPLLKRLTLEGSGTYQHSIVVGHLAEAAAVAIGANGLFCRVSTLFHDVGKLINTQYFTENQQNGVSIHQLLTPLESTQVIISHVSEGVQLARKYNLPEPFIDIIKEHHGTTLAYFFYHKQCELMGGDKSLVNEKDFRYAGPKPRSKESAIIMIADTLEAASRCMTEFTEEKVSQLVDTLVKEKLEDGQFDNCLLTFEELGMIKKMMVNTLVVAGHTRIKYPARQLAEPVTAG